MASAKLLLMAALLAVDVTMPLIKAAAVESTPIETTTPAAGTPVTTFTPVVANVRVLETTASTPVTANVRDTGAIPTKLATHVVATVHDVRSAPATGTTATTSEQPRPSSPAQGRPEDAAAAGQDTSGDDEPVNAQQVANIIFAYPRHDLYDHLVRVIYDVRKTTSVHVERLVRI